MAVLLVRVLRSCMYLANPKYVYGGVLTVRNKETTHDERGPTKVAVHG